MRREKERCIEEKKRRDKGYRGRESRDSRKDILFYGGY